MTTCQRSCDEMPPVRPEGNDLITDVAAVGGLPSPNLPAACIAPGRSGEAAVVVSSSVSGDRRNQEGEDIDQS